MKRAKLLVVLMLITVLSAGCRWGIFAPGHEVTVVGYWINTEDPPTPKAGCLQHFTTSQVGEARHVGAFTGVGFTCIATPPSQVDVPPHFFYPDAPPYFVADFENEMVWTTDRGDELWLRPNDGTFVQSLATTQVSVLGTLRISGGTGRFSGATGSLSVRSANEDGSRLEYEGTMRLDR